MKTVVLAGDQHYREQLATTVKSILYHNKNVKIYIFHQDISPDWFSSVSQLAKKLDSEIVNVRLNAAELDASWLTQQHISPITYARYFIPRYVAEKRVLYLDSDLVVTRDLSDFFQMDFDGKMLAAVRDANGSGFNAGVLLIDNEAWRRQNLLPRLLEQTKETMEDVRQGRIEHFNGDQTILNQIFQDEWLELDKSYNLQVGHDLVAFYSGWQQQFALEQKPLIIHFTTFRKPWSSLTAYRFRQLWWTYYHLEYSQILDHHQGRYNLSDSSPKADLDCLIVTDSQDLEQIEHLVSLLPNCHFHIAAYTDMGERLLALAAYENVYLYPEVVGVVLDDLMAHCQLYLDIHHGQDSQVISYFEAGKKPVFAFDKTQKTGHQQVVFPADKPELMIEAIERLAKKDVPVAKAIVLAADYAYSDQVLTTIKSICYHNHQVKFYLLNSDFPSEWFETMNRRLAPFGSEIINGRVNAQLLKGYQTNISYTVFLRYFIADFVVEDKVLYLDCDIVVTTDLTELFATDLGTYPVAAVKDLGGQVYFNEHIFNAGVLLVNNALWKAEKITQRLIEMTNELHDKVSSGDQSILNLLFKNRWLELPFAYNAITLHTMFTDYQPEAGHFPPIIHYLTERKPWKPFTQSIYRQVWWFYHDLDWSDFKQPVPALSKERLHAGKTKPFTCLVYTYSCDLLHMETLIQALPHCHFYLAAPVVVADSIAALLRYDNVSVCSNIAGLTNLVDFLVEESDVLLDINADSEVDGIIARFKDLGKPVYAFEGRAHGQQGQRVFAQENPQAMIEALAFLAEWGKEWAPGVLGIEATLDYILNNQSSVARFGDGEMDLIAGKSIPYQNYDKQLAQRLQEILSLQSREDLVICLSDVFENLGRYNQAAQDFWQGHLKEYQELYQELCRADWYGSTFISRPYMDLLDKAPSTSYFAKLKQLWQGQDILIVEGATSRSGVGNDLFAGAASISRLICPSCNAFARFDDIKTTIERYGQGKLILLMLGPTAKILAYDLAQAGYRALDLGHIDSEYEWFQMQADHKVKLKHKHTAEHNFDQDIEFLADEAYEEQIVADLSQA